MEFSVFISRSPPGASDSRCIASSLMSASRPSRSFLAMAREYRSGIVSPG
jgi:hypothetical protein